MVLDLEQDTQLTPRYSVVHFWKRMKQAHANPCCNPTHSSTEHGLAKHSHQKLVLNFLNCIIQMANTSQSHNLSEQCG